MSELDDTCILHRAGPARALEVKAEAAELLRRFDPEELKEMDMRYSREGISPGGSADMLALTILIDSLTR
jgi:triphosphoribosyl-dephospho-CoA synthase